MVYYSIDNGPYQVAHMRATGAPDEYVGYIKGYHQASEVNYYVFGADESGHRYQQPVFGELDPHHFTVNMSILRGDVNNDGKVDIADVNIVVNIILGKDSISYFVYDIASEKYQVLTNGTMDVINIFDSLAQMIGEVL